MDRAARIRVNDQLVLGAFDVYSDGTERPVSVPWAAALPLVLQSPSNGPTCTVVAGAETNGTVPFMHYQTVTATTPEGPRRFIAEIGPAILAELRPPPPVRIGTVVRLLTVNGKPA